MARINHELLDRIANKLHVHKGRVYALIADKASRTGLDRDIAALLVAADHNINYQRLSTREQRTEMRGALGGSASKGVPVANNDLPSSARHRSKRLSAAKRPRAKGNTVFVVHGRNDDIRKSMFDFLRALELKPLEWEKVLQMAKGNNPFIGDVLDEVMSKVQAVIVLFSPDDEARLKPEFQLRSDPSYEKNLTGQPRPNVLFEAGLALGSHPEKTVLVEVGRIRKFSDIGGRHIVRLANDFKKRNDLANRLQKIGCQVDRTATDWTTAGNFVA